MTIFACIDKKRTDLGGSFPLTIGFAICVGALFGGIYGLSNGIRHNNGIVWKPFLGVVGGGVLGFTVGLFPFHTFGFVLIGDVANTIHINYKLKKK